jgi:hypothetical protein
MKMTLALALASLATLAVADLPGQTLDEVRIGARIRVELSRGKKTERLVGVLVSRSPASLQVQPDRSNDLVDVPLDQARKIEVSLEQHSAAGRTALGGFLLGLTAGMAAGFGCDCAQPGLAGVTIGAIFGGLGAGFGALFGMGARVDEWTPVIHSSAPMTNTGAPAGVTLLHLTF